MSRAAPCWPRPLPAAVLLIVGAFAAPLHAATWQVDEAPLRFTLGLSSRPSHASAGYFAKLPDGGLLPGPHPVTRVLDDSGRELASYALWYNPRDALGIVFEAPSSSSSVDVYVMPSSSLNVWTAKSGLTPSPVQCTDPGRGSLGAARGLAAMGSVGSRTHFQVAPGHGNTAFCIVGDPTGRPRPASIYLLAYLVVTKPGKTWIAPFSFIGQSEMRVNGHKIVPRKRIDKWGGIGQYMNLSAGLHKAEIFAGCPGKGDFTGGSGVMYLTWTPPDTPIDELGGPRKKKDPYGGTSAQASRVVRSDELAHSGRCSIREVSRQDGGPVAHFDFQAVELYWFEDTEPVFAYVLRAFHPGNPDGTEYTWRPANNAATTAPAIAWLYRGLQEHAVTLTARQGDRRSTCTRPFYAYSGVGSDLNIPDTRATFRKAFLTMLKAYPPNADPAAKWSRSMWRCFHDVQEMNAGQALVAHVMLDRWEVLSKHMTREQQVSLEDLFFPFITKYSPDRAIAWLDERIATATSGERRALFKAMLAEVHMYQQDDLDAAREVVKADATGTFPGAGLARIRLGDIAFLEGNLDEAARLWGEAQDRVNLARDVLKEAGVQWDVEDSAGFAELTHRMGRVDEWKQSAVLDTSLSASVASLVEQGYLHEAASELRRWERAFPLSKLTSDYLIREAEFYLAVDNNRRARRLMEAYTATIEASSYLARAASLLLECMLTDKEPNAVIRTYCETMKKRFEFHPFAKKLDAVLESLGADGTKRAATLDILQ